MIKTSILYAIAGFARFILVIYITLRTVQLLRIDEYSLFGIANVFAMLTGLVWFFNFDSSFQKIYSKPKLRKTVNFVTLVMFVALSCCFFLIQCVFWLVFKKIDPQWSFIIVTQVQYFPHYCMLVALNSFVLSLLNSKQMSAEYVVQMTLPSLIVAGYLFVAKDIDLKSIFVLHTVALMFSISVICCLNIGLFNIRNYTAKRSTIIFKYIINYTLRSIPTISTKYLLDLVIRSIILQRFGHLQLASYNLCQNLLGVMRTLEQSISRAVTPYILADKNINLPNLSFARRLTFLQSFITINLIFSSFFWLPILSSVIKDKPDDLYSPVTLILLGLIIIVGYWKNYCLMYIKKYSLLIKRFYNQTTCVNILLIIMFLSLEGNLSFLISCQCLILILHNVALKTMMNKKMSFNKIINEK